MGNVIDFGEKGLALSLGETAVTERGVSADVMPEGLDKKGKTKWCADRLVAQRRPFAPYTAWGISCGRFATGIAGIAVGIDVETCDFMVALYDGIEPVAEFRYGVNKKNADDAAELFRCRIRSMGPRGGGKAKAMELGRMKGVAEFAKRELDALERAIDGMRTRKGGLA